MDKDSAYRGHETWWNSFRMGMKMYTSIFTYSFAVHILIFMIVSMAFMPAGSMKFAFEYMRHKGSGIRNPYVSVKDDRIDAAFSAMLWKLIAIFIAAGIPSYLAGYPLFLGYFKKRSKEQIGNQYIRGAKLIAPKELAKQMKTHNDAADLPVGLVRLPRSAEVKHLLFIGAPGTGKTNQASQMIERLVERGDKMIIYDFKGDYLAKFYDPERDIIFNPLDTRCQGWNLFNELSRYMDIDAVAHSLIAQSYMQDPFWNDAARDVFSGILHYLYQNNARSNSDIWAAVTAPISHIAGWLKGTRGGERGYVYIQDASSKQAMSVVAVMMQYVKSFEYMSKADGSFSITEWLGDPKPGTIFITNYADVKDTLRPILSLFVDLLGRKLLSMKDDRKRRVFFLLDEFGTLQRLSTIKDLLTLSRSKGGAVFIGVQDKGQIDKIYSPEFSQSILNACGNSIIYRVSDPVTAKYLSDRIGKTEILEVDQALSMGVSDNRDGVSLMQRSREKDLVLPSEIMNLRDLEAYLKIANYSITRIEFQYRSLCDRHEPFVVRDDLLLEKIAAEQLLIASTAKAVVSSETGDVSTNNAGERESLAKTADSDRGLEIDEMINN
ncbi:MAG: type IV secretion system DNA-binding domain-containing protein [Nitrospirota bacterium]